ncbi:MAG: tyrosine-type recombinase/integrase [Planctomycetota bacterium]|jgi:integrase
MASIFKQQYTSRDPTTGKKVKKKTVHWYIDYKAEDGSRKRIKGYKDKQATKELAAQLELEAGQAQRGMVDKYKDHRSRALLKHLEDFKATLIHKGTTEKHAYLVYNRAKAVIENCKFIYMSDISASRVQRYLAERRKEGLSIRSSNFYLQAVKQFCRWMVADSRVAENPLAYLKGQNPKTDIRHARRALSLDELKLLIEKTTKGEKHSGMTGKERVMLYTLAVNTGLRAGELASLTWDSFNLSDSMPTVTVSAAYSKHRRDDVQPLPPEAVLWFREWQTEVNGCKDEKVFENFDKGNAAKMLRKDLEKAEIKYRDDAGRVIDFHALRHTYITNVVKSGASAKVAQTLARHSDIKLTMDTYTHLNLCDGKDALDSLPRLTDLEEVQSESNTGEMLLTGTDNLPLSSGAYKKLTKNDFSDSDKMASNVAVITSTFIWGRVR